MIKFLNEYLIQIMLVVAVIGLICAFLLSPTNRPNAIKENWSIVTTDQDTGCQYISPIGGSGITPRLNAEGKQICLPQKQ